MLEATAGRRHPLLVPRPAPTRATAPRQRRARTRPRPIVDCGAGTGRNLDWLGRIRTGHRRRTDSRAASSVGRARGRRLVRGTVTALPLPTPAPISRRRSTCSIAWTTTSEARRRCGEMWRVLRPGGLALVNVAALDVLRGSHSTLTHEVRRYTPARLHGRLRTRRFRGRAPDVHEHVVCSRPRSSSGASSADGPGVAGLGRRPAGAAGAGERRCSNALLDRRSLVLRGSNLPIGTSLMAVASKPGRWPEDGSPSAGHFRQSSALRSGCRAGSRSDRRPRTGNP